MTSKGKKTGKFLARTVMILLLAVLVFALFRIADILHERGQSEQINAQLAQMAVTENLVLPEEAIQSTPQTQQVVQPERDKHPMPITVDFEVLRQQSEAIRGWIYCPDTPINYPVVQGSDNRYYLRHMINGQPNQAGSIFLDYRNSSDLSDGYSLIHGHNLQDSAMFGTLPNYGDQAYYEAHPVVYLLTPTGNYVVELFAGFTATSDDKIYRIPATKQHRMELVEDCIARSDFVSQLVPKEGEQLLTLSTCSYAYDDARYVVIGVLREN